MWLLQLACFWEKGNLGGKNVKTTEPNQDQGHKSDLIILYVFGYIHPDMYVCEFLFMLDCLKFVFHVSTVYNQAYQRRKSSRQTNTQRERGVISEMVFKHIVIKAPHWSLTFDPLWRQRKALMTRCWGQKRKRYVYV